MRDGPFGAVTDPASPEFYIDGVSSGVDPASLPGTAVPLIFDEEGLSVVFFIDPANGLVFIGDSQMFDSGYSSVTNAIAGDTDDQDRFLLNVLAYLVNCAQYGSGFADLFVPGNEALYEAAFPSAP